MKPLVTPFALALLAAALGACDGGGGGTGPGVEAGRPSDGGAGGAADGPGAEGGAAPADAAPAGPELKPGEVALGSIGLTQFPSGPAVVSQATASAGFSIGPACPEQTLGDCTFTDCTFQGRDLEAGAVSILGGTAPVMLEDGMALTTAIFKGAETLRFVVGGSASGVPAFEETLVAPSATPVQFTFPALASGRGIVKRSEPLAVTWTNATSGTVTVNLVVPRGPRSVIAICSYAAARGTASIPADLLARFPAGDAFAYLGALASKKVQRAPWTIDLVLFQVGWANGQASFGQLVLE